MGREINYGRIVEFVEVVRRHPGRSAVWYAKEMQVKPSYIEAVMASAERVGFLFAEDGRGRLTIFQEPSVRSFRDEIAEQYEAWRKSGLTVYAFERRMGVSQNTLKYRFLSRGYELPAASRLRLSEEEIAEHYARWIASGIPLGRYERENHFKEHALRARFQVRGWLPRWGNNDKKERPGTIQAAE